MLGTASCTAPMAMLTDTAAIRKLGFLLGASGINEIINDDFIMLPFSKLPFGNILIGEFETQSISPFQGYGRIDFIISQDFVLC
jgi:hypothetical protein